MNKLLSLALIAGISLTACTERAVSDEGPLAHTSCNIIIYLNIDGCLACDAYMHDVLRAVKTRNYLILTNQNARSKVTKHIFEETYSQAFSPNIQILEGEHKQTVLQNLSPPETMRSNVLLLDKNGKVIFSLVNPLGKPEPISALKQQLNLHGC